MDIELSTDGDLVFNAGELGTITGGEELAQQCRIVLNTRAVGTDPNTGEAVPGNWTFDQDLGIDKTTLYRSRGLDARFASELIRADLLEQVPGLTGATVEAAQPTASGGWVLSVTIEGDGADDETIADLAVL
jgi:hypothetical protein